MKLTQSLADREKLWLSSPTHFWTLDRVSDALGGGPRGARSLSGVSTDTRRIAPGELFVALSGDSFDAHEFLRQAVSRGAGAVVVARPELAAGLDVPVYVTNDTLVALGSLASYRRRAWSAGRLVVGITGTNGKTSTKDLVTAALESRLDVHATTGNLNNRVGVPLTLLALPESAHAAVIEMGTSLPGEIETLREMAEPQIGVVTAVAEGHLEGLGSIEGVLAEKTSIYNGTAVAIAPASQPEIAERARRTSRSVVTAGLGDGDYRAERWGLAEDGSGWLEIGGIRVQVPLKGLHNLRNAMLALAVAREAGVRLDDAVRGIAGMPTPSMRLELQTVGSLLLINDAYNSNPASALAAMELLASLPSDRQKVLVLGTMRELGPASRELHLRVANRALESGADLIAGLGEFATAFDAIGESRNVVTAPDVTELWERLRPRLDTRAAILLKASRGVRLERIVPLIQEWAER